MATKDHGKNRGGLCRAALCASLSMALVLAAALAAMAVSLCAQRQAATQFAGQGGAPDMERLSHIGEGTVIDRYVRGEDAIDWAYWQGINPDIVAWILVPNTTISYPVVQARPADPSYYLYHDIYRARNEYGAIYIDAGCTPESLNVVVFGHNMGIDSKAMFGELAACQGKDYLLGHSTALWLTPKEAKAVPLRAAEATSGSAATKVTGFEGQEELAAWYKERYAAAQTKLHSQGGVSDSAVSQVLTLVTCSYGSYNERTIVYGVWTAPEIRYGSGEAAERALRAREEMYQR